MISLTTNGIIMQKASDNYYRGIEGENWYLNYENIFEEYYDMNIDKSWCDENYVDCCNDIEYIKLYMKESEKLNISYHILLCESERRYPQIGNEYLYESRFLGYDYAYSGGSYYSCILNDIISRRIPEFEKCKLNKFGLFDTINEITEFIELRTELINVYKPLTFESGNFIIYKINEIIHL